MTYEERKEWRKATWCVSCEYKEICKRNDYAEENCSILEHFKKIANKAKEERK